MTGLPCPHCSTLNPAEALFCENCGYDFTTGTMPRPQPAPEDRTHVTVGSRQPRPGVRAAGRPRRPRGIFDWVAEVWIDPAWYEAQESPDPMPSPGLPDVVPLRAPRCWSAGPRAAATSTPRSTARPTPGSVAARPSSPRTAPVVGGGPGLGERDLRRSGQRSAAGGSDPGRSSASWPPTTGSISAPGPGSSSGQRPTTSAPPSASLGVGAPGPIDGPRSLSEEAWRSRSASSTSLARSWWRPPIRRTTIEKALEQAFANDSFFSVTDERGRKVLIPAAKIAYVDLGQENARHVGFGAL